MYRVIMFSKDNCPFCMMAESYLKKNNIDFTVNKINDDIERFELYKELSNKYNKNVRTVPQLIAYDQEGNDTYIGGFSDLKEAYWLTFDPTNIDDDF